MLLHYFFGQLMLNAKFKMPKKAKKQGKIAKSSESDEEDDLFES